MQLTQKLKTNVRVTEPEVIMRLGREAKRNKSDKLSMRQINEEIKIVRHNKQTRGAIK